MNAPPRPPSDELRSLVDAFVDGTIAPAERGRLEALLRDDPEARLFYVTYSDLHAELQWERRGGGKGRAAKRPPFRLTLPAAFRHRRVWLAGAAAALLAAAAFLLFLPPKAPAAATVARLAGALWDGGGNPLRAGDPAGAGDLELTEGLAELSLGNGVRLVLEAPARIELRDRGRAFLRYGRVVAKVSKAAVGFTLETTRTSVVDLGTEFGVGVDFSGKTMVQVYVGSVISRMRDDGTTPHREERLTAGQAREIGTASTAAAFVSTRFIRALPPPVQIGPQEEDLPYSRSRFDRIHVVPAPKAVAVDGDLSDWDLSGRFETRTADPYGAHYYIQGAMMYDERHLYIGAHIGDPAPLRSLVDPRSDPAAGWKGGGLQIRFSTSPALGWPLEGENHGLPGRDPSVGRRPQDVNGNLVHATLWYFQPRDEACLHLAYGMDFHGDAINPPGWRGAFRKDPDGLGYTLEAAIPWTLLGAGTRPPRAGDELGCCWVVNWSDADGRSWKGQLTEITNPRERGSRGAEGATYVRAATWGRAVYHAMGALPRGTVIPGD